jgi:hypothetical protein
MIAEYEDVIRGVQMQISMIESGYEEVKKHYNDLTKTKTRREAEDAETEANKQILEDRDTAQALMEETKFAMEDM